MTSMRDPDLLIDAFLDEGWDELPDRVYDDVRAEIEHTRQRFVFGPWREEHIMNAARFALGAAAVVLLAVIGIKFLPGVISGPGATPTPAPTPTLAPVPEATPTLTQSLEPSPTPRVLVNGPTRLLPAGRYLINALTATRLPLTFTLPEGWSSWENQDVSKGGSKVVPDSETAVFASWIVDSVYRDACNWTDNLTTGLRTRQAIVEALASQANVDATTPIETTLGGLPATSLTLSVPSEFDQSACDEEFMRHWPDAGPNEQFGWPTKPGQITTVYVVDTPGGLPSVVFTAVNDNASDADKAEAAAVLESVQFEDN